MLCSFVSKKELLGAIIDIIKSKFHCHSFAH